MRSQSEQSRRLEIAANETKPISCYHSNEVNLLADRACSDFSSFTVPLSEDVETLARYHGDTAPDLSNNHWASGGAFVDKEHFPQNSGS